MKAGATTDAPLLLSVTQAARLRNCSAKWLHYLISSDRLPVTPNSRGPRRVSLTDLEACTAFRPTVKAGELTIRQAAEFLGLSVTTVRAWCDTHLAGCRVPGTAVVRFYQARLEQEFKDLLQLLLTTTQAARELNVHPDTLYRWTRQGTIKSVITPGGRNRYPVAEVERLKLATR